MKNIFTFLLCLIPILSQAQVYDFPIKPGTEEWGNLITEKERFEAMQIPKDILKSISTYDLITTCMNYPAMMYFTAFNNPQDGMDIIIQNFNGLQELMGRDDAPTELLSIYKQMDSKTMSIQNLSINQSSWSIRRYYFELLLTQNGIIDKMNKEERSCLDEEARKKLHLKIDNQEEFSSIDYRPTLMIMSKILNKSANTTKEITEDELLNQLITSGSLRSTILENQPIYENDYIYTPKRTPVLARKLVGGELTNSKKNDSKKEWLNYYNNRITYVGEATHAYNCHAYAWYCSEGHSYVWINTPGDDAFWNDNSYVLTNTPDENCKVSFPNDDHSAITTSQSGYLKSKWGSGPLFIHSRNDCPYPNSTTLRYYRYPDPNYNTVPDKPLPVTFNMISNGSFSASVSNDSRYNVDQYEWRADYANDWYVYAQNADKSNVLVYRSSTPRSCSLYARAHNSYGWGEWQAIGWLYASQSYSLSVAQNPVNTILCVQIEPIAETQAIKKNLSTYSTEAYNISLYNNAGIIVHQSTVNSDGNSITKLDINVSTLSNGIYFLRVANNKGSEKPQTLNIIVKH